jgi:hypothetical protein
MKLILAFTLLCSWTAFAQEKREEFDPRDENICFQEMRSLGCGNSSEVSSDCVEKRRQKMSAKCRYFHDKRRNSESRHRH